RAAACTLSQIASPEFDKYAKRIAILLCYKQYPKVRTYCITAIEKLANPSCITPLILSSIHFRPHEKALVEQLVLGFGVEIAPTLLKIIESDKKHDRCRLLAGRILVKMKRSLLKENLVPVLRKEIDRAYFYFFHAHTVQQQIPEQNLSILSDALITGYHSVVDLMIQLIGTANSIEECEVLARSLRSKNRKTRAHALETLEKASPQKMFQLIEPLLDEDLIQPKLDRFLKKGGIPLNVTQLLDKMAASPSPTDQIVSLGLKAKLQMPNWKEAIHDKLDSEEEILNHFAEELLEVF
ncbi:MAG: hypothetical protein ACKVOH_01615, partial [Chlamydiales bacterium]